jgi:excisionase family DNA binding protein
LKYLTTAQAAERAGVTDRGIRMAISRGTLPAESVAGRWQISAEALNRYRARRK